MGPGLTAEELAALYPHLTPEQRLEMERWHRGRTHARMVGEPVDENAQPPYPEHPQEDIAGLDPSGPDYLVNLAIRTAARVDQLKT